MGKPGKYLYLMENAVTETKQEYAQNARAAKSAAAAAAFAAAAPTPVNLLTAGDCTGGGEYALTATQSMCRCLRLRSFELKTPRRRPQLPWRACRNRLATAEQRVPRVRAAALAALEQ